MNKFLLIKNKHLFWGVGNIQKQCVCKQIVHSWSDWVKDYGWRVLLTTEGHIRQKQIL